MNNLGKLLLVLVFVFSVLTQAVAQVGGPGNPTSDGRQGAGLIRTAVPFLLISPDARSAAMGDAGVATSPDANSIHWNPAKIAFLQETTAVSASYSPWLQKLIPDINLAYLSAVHKLDGRNSLGASLRYFSLGNIEFRQTANDEAIVVRPSEFAFDGAFARNFGENFSLGTVLRFVYSNLTNGQYYSGQQTKPGTALAADVSAYYKTAAQLIGKDAFVSAGINVSNIGNKLAYVENGDKLFLPTNLKIGAASTFFIDNLNEFTFAVDLNKLLVPTPPVIEYDPVSEQPRIVAGRDPSAISVPAAIFGSFSDAPGGFREEMQEISYSAGGEYVFNKQFALRAGYFYDNPNKGNRSYFTIGAGLRYTTFNLNFAYLLANQQKSPLANTLRFSLAYSFNK